MSDEDWGSGYVRTLGMLLDGRAMNEWAASGELVRDDALLCLFNAFWEPIDFLLPAVEGVSRWEVLVNTYHSTAVREDVPPCSHYRLEARSLVFMACPG
jgi:glycogen operon protein